MSLEAQLAVPPRSACSTASNMQRGCIRVPATAVRCPPASPPRSELDRLKHSQRKHIVESALHALHRLRVLTSSRDAFVRLQPAGEHQQVGAAAAGS